MLHVYFFLVSLLFFFAANALEMLGITLCLSGGVRNDIDSAFSQSLTNYLQCNLIRHALRSQIHACRALVCLDPVLYGKDAAVKFDRLSCDIVAQETYMGPAQPSNELEGTQRQTWVGVMGNNVTNHHIVSTSSEAYHAVFSYMPLSFHC